MLRLANNKMRLAGLASHSLTSADLKCCSERSRAEQRKRLVGKSLQQDQDYPGQPCRLVLCA